MRWLRSDARTVPPSPSPSASDVAAMLSMKSRRVVVTLRLAKDEAILARAEARTFRCRTKHACGARAYAGCAHEESPDDFADAVAVAHAASDARPCSRDAGDRFRRRPHEGRNVRRLRRGREQQ